MGSDKENGTGSKDCHLQVKEEKSILVKHRAQIMGQVTWFQRYLSDFQEVEGNMEELEVQLATFEPTWNEYDKVHSQIENWYRLRCNS
jgi:hypothetical protein